MPEPADSGIPELYGLSHSLKYGSVSQWVHKTSRLRWLDLRHYLGKQYLLEFCNFSRNGNCDFKYLAIAKNENAKCLRARKD